MVRFQIGHTRLLLLFALAITLPALLLARGLELKTGFDSLLPESKPSVRELRRVTERMGGVSTCTIVLRSTGDRRALQLFGDALVADLRTLDPSWVTSAEDGVQAEREFIERRKWLFLPLERLTALDERIEERRDFEIHGSLAGDEPPPITRATIEETMGARARLPGPDHPDGYYMDSSATTLVVVVRTPIAVGDLPRSTELRRKVEAVVTARMPERATPPITAQYTGDLVTSLENYGAVKRDLASIGVLGILFVLAVDFLFFLRIRVVLSMALAIGIGVVWTFAVTKLVIGHLNTASGFLVSIVFGNGLNFGVLLRARYNEARRHGEDLHGALSIAYRDTWRPTLTVAAAASAGFLTLATTDFRGFKHFGAIGAYGMLLCWLAIYAFMAPLLVLLERSPTTPPAGGILWRRIVSLSEGGIRFGAPFAWLSTRRPRLLASLGVLIGIAALAGSVAYLRRKPLEYDARNLGNDGAIGRSSAAQLSEQVDVLIGRGAQEGVAIVVDRLDQVLPLKSILDQRRDAASVNKKPFERILTIFDLIPTDQRAKIVVLDKMRGVVERMRELGHINDEDWAALQPILPPRGLAPFDIADLPATVVRPFTEKDGSRGRVIYIVPTEGESLHDLRYLMRWADAFRSTELPNGEKIVGSGRAVIFADMIDSVVSESPRATVLSFIMTALVVAIAFARGQRGFGSVALALGTLVIGMSMMGAVLAIARVKINFLNFVAVPITVGIGVDYAVNIVHRWRLEPPGSIALIVRETGGAVVLCSLTTTLGYLALLTSINKAVRSFGLVAVIGELTCVAAAVVVLPAMLATLDRRSLRERAR